jgi:DNA-directed RNA polymerase subunit M/transcription elongation factor TFIIS
MPRRAHVRMCNLVCQTIIPPKGVDNVKHIHALAAAIENINHDLATNEKQLLAAKKKVARLEGQAMALRQQLARAQDSEALKDDSCPQCYANSGADQKLEARDDEDNHRHFECPACQWTHVEIPQAPPAVPQ